FGVALASNGLAIFAILGTELFVAQYLQLGLGIGPLEAGLWTLPSSAGIVAGSMLAPALAGAVRPASLVAAGMAVAAAGLAVLTQVEPASGLAALVAGSVALALGVGLVMTLSTDVIVAAAPPERAGGASALSETGTELGGALGIALLGSLGTAVYRSQVADAVPAGEALTHGLQAAALASAVVMAGMAVVAAVVLRERSAAVPATPS
ncbi:MAG TPA: MFS transporter, partial [Solirubrobacteraceae bacterium]|nr:MFS transporter [Solirubrobacteraceae bacterium]